MPDSPSVPEQLAVIDYKLDVLIEQRTDHEYRLRILETNQLSPEQSTDRELRIRRLEQFRYVLLGAALALGGTAGAIADRINV